MKKKIILIGLMLVVCFVITLGVKSLQKSSAAGEVKNNSLASQSQTTEESNQEENNDNQVKQAEAGQPDDKQNQKSESSSKATDKTETLNTSKSTALKTQDQEKPQSKTTVKKDNSTNTNSNSTANSQKPAVQTVEPQTVKQNPNLIITNTITGQKILTVNLSFEGMTAADATRKALDAAGKSYKISGIGNSLYFSSIDGLRERASGPSSGWCYYVNGNKLSDGSGSYTLKKDDTLEWKYLKDGISN